MLHKHSFSFLVVRGLYGRNYNLEVTVDGHNRVKTHGFRTALPKRESAVKSHLPRAELSFTWKLFCSRLCVSRHTASIAKIRIPIYFVATAARPRVLGFLHPMLQRRA